MNADERFYIGYIKLSSSKVLKYSELNILPASKIQMVSKTSCTVCSKALPLEVHPIKM